MKNTMDIIMFTTLMYPTKCIHAESTTLATCLVGIVSQFLSEVISNGQSMVSMDETCEQKQHYISIYTSQNYLRDNNTPHLFFCSLDKYIMKWLRKIFVFYQVGMVTYTRH